MTQIPLFCPKCESENPDWLEQSETCAVCGHTYPTAARREEISKEQVLPVLNISSTPPASRINVKGKKISVDRGIKWGKGLVILMVMFCIALLSLFFMTMIGLMLNLIGLHPLGTIVLTLLFCLMILYILYRQLTDDSYQREGHADTIITIQESNILVFTQLYGLKSKNIRTLFPIEAEYIFYTLAGENSAVRLSSQNRKGSIPLIENLQPAEARWLTLYMRKYLQTHNIQG